MRRLIQYLSWLGNPFQREELRKKGIKEIDVSCNNAVNTASGIAQADGEILHPRLFLSMQRTEAEQAVRSKCRSIYIGNDIILSRCLGKYKMYLDARDRGISPHLMLDGYWEWWLTRFIIEKVSEGMTVIDIGANLGYYTLLLSDLVGDTGRCLAFEPNPAVAEKLEQSVLINGFGGRARIVRCALGRLSEGHLPFFVPASDPKNAHIVEEGFRASPEMGTIIRVPVTTADGAIDERVDFIKIDAEGAEYDILIGMRNIIERHRPKIVIEFNADRHYDGRVLLEYLLQFYNRFSYIDADSKLRDATIDKVLRENYAEDWLLYFE
jgi:FkbM family methyltransferase